MVEASARRGGDGRWVIVLIGLIAGAIVWVDVPVASWIREHGFWPGFKLMLRAVRLPGTFGFTLLLASALVLTGRLKWTGGAAILLAGASASVMAGGLKMLIGRARPSSVVGMFEWMPLHERSIGEWLPAHLSFPSGDAALAFATAATLARLLPRTRWPAFLWAGLVCAARVLQGVHYPSDVIAGAVVGIVGATLAERAWRPRSSATLAELPC